MSRFARQSRVFFLEEPIFEGQTRSMRIEACPQTGVTVCTPVLPAGLNHSQVVDAQRELLDALVEKENIKKFVAWYYTPMAREFSRHTDPEAIVYDCMDELSAFAGAPPTMHTNEAELFASADLVFTGGASLFESKRKQHHSVHCFPSSVDVEHFAGARTAGEPADQAQIPQPKLGFAGVIDERMDVELLREAAEARPNWQFVMIGPVVKINPELLPKLANIHYLGMKPYGELPAYFSGWRIGMLPFAMNDSTRFISPTKTPEYLAAGLRVVSTPIRDVVTPYGDMGLAEIASTPDEFVAAAEKLLNDSSSEDFHVGADAFLSKSSWDSTWEAMNDLIESRLAFRELAEGSTAAKSQEDAAAPKGVAHV